MPLGKKVGLSPGHIVLDGDPVGTQPPQQPLPTFGPRLLWPNGRPSQQLLSSCCDRPTRYAVRFRSNYAFYLIAQCLTARPLAGSFFCIRHTVSAFPLSSWRESKAIFCQVSNARFHRLQVGQISRNLHTIRGSVSRWILSGRIFENFPLKGRFFQKASFQENASMSFDFRPP